MAGTQIHASTVATRDGAILELLTAASGDGQADGGVVVVHGSMVTAELYRELALRLAESLRAPVHVYNRRGRGASSPQPENYSLAVEIADLGAVLAHTGSQSVFGHNYGGCIALNAGRTLDITQLAVYDPIISFNGSYNADWLDDYEAALQHGDEEKALAVLLRGLQAAGPISKLPLPVLTVLNRIGSRMQPGKTLTRLLPTGPREIRAVVAADSKAKPFEQLPLETLVLVGGASPEYFSEAKAKLDGVLPASDFGVLPKLAHDAPERPARVLIERLTEFFSS
ncbi:alpha/beta fold hydrolase [Sinomonas albida]|uniref:alpha/beta fold hydrolase n=1 Tax=Sinomonas albida TaxID=369942 RepID=UPI0010A8E6A9|nr:alpha/beta hydrolase [Sinomonas albida]